LLPFIDIALLKSTVEKFCPDSKLSTAELVRNSMGTIYCYKHDPTSIETVTSPNPSIGLPDISVCHSTISVIEFDEGPSTSKFEPKLVSGTQLPYPGFPSLNVLPIASIALTKAGLNCFGVPSKYLNTILHLTELPELAPIEQLAESLLGKSVFVNWPMMHEAKVIGLSSESREIKILNGKRKVSEFGKVEADKWRTDSMEMLQSYHVGNGTPGSGGVYIGPVRLRLKVQPLQGMKINPNNGSKKKYFGQQEADVPLQLCLFQAPAPDPRFIERGPATLQDRFPLNSQVVLTKGKYRGCKGTVISIADAKNVAVNVQIIPPEIPFGLFAVREVQESYMSSLEAAKMLRMNAGVLGKIMGRLQFEQGKYDLGLNLKTADGMCVPGYTRKKVENARKAGSRQVWSAGDTLLVVGSQKLPENGDKDERIQWEYTPRAIKLVNEYRTKFPQLFSGIMKNSNEKRYDANEIFGNNGEAWLPVIRDWLDKHESAKIPRSPVTTESMPREAVTKVEKYAAIRNLALQKKGYPKESLIKIPGSALYREGSIGATDVLLAADLNNSEAPQLGDRIVNLCVDGIPFGAKGTVIGIHEAATTGCVEVVMDEEFMGGTSLQGACSNFRGRLCLWAHLLKVTPENASALVERMVPKASDKANSDRMRAMVNNQVEQHKDSVTSWDGRKDESVSLKNSNGKPLPQQSDGESQTVKAKSPLRPQAKARSTSRDGSSARGKQGAWEQARGPDEKTIGFQGKRTATKSGHKQWKELVTKNESTARDAPKTVLHRPPSQTGAASTEEATLKAILGLQPPPSQQTLSSASKTSGDFVTQQTPSSAAEKLRALMISSRPATGSGLGPTPFGQGQAPTGFNFTYVEEGQELPQAMPINVPGPIMPQHPLMYAPMGPGPYPLTMPGYNGFVPLQQGTTTQTFNLRKTTPDRAPVNEEDFPALGSAPRSQQMNAGRQPRVDNVMVPSVLASKQKR
jgi:5'-3' exoribonuclease 1